jgi:hypothetical protein
MTATPGHAREVRDFTARDRLMRGVAADRVLSPTARLVAVRVALFLNCKTGRCDPSYGTLAREIGISERSAIRAIAALEARGWVAVERSAGGRRDNTNQFHLFTPAERVTPVSPQGMTAESPLDASGVTTATPRGDTPRQQGMTPESPNKRRENNEEKNEGDRLSPATDLFNEGASPQSPPAAKTKKRELAKSSIDDGFDRFWLEYPRRVAKGKARIAFEKVLKDTGAEVEAVIAGARRYCAERAGEDSKFTPYPATWLHAHRWLDEAAATPRSNGDVTIDNTTGEVVANRPARAVGGTWADEAAAKHQEEARRER